jgi:hypothetical protein
MNRHEWAIECFAVVDARQPEKIAKSMTDDIRLPMATMVILPHLAMKHRRPPMWLWR